MSRAGDGARRRPKVSEVCVWPLITAWGRTPVGIGSASGRPGGLSLKGASGLYARGQSQDELSIRERLVMHDIRSRWENRLLILSPLRQ